MKLVLTIFAVLAGSALAGAHVFLVAPPTTESELVALQAEPVMLFTSASPPVVTIEIREAAPDRLTATDAWVRVTDGAGEPIPNAAVRFVINYIVPGTGGFTPLNTFTVTTGADGTLDFFIPRDIGPTNIPGNHIAIGRYAGGGHSETGSAIYAIS